MSFMINTRNKKNLIISVLLPVLSVCSFSNNYGNLNSWLKLANARLYLRFYLRIKVIENLCPWYKISCQTDRRLFERSEIHPEYF